MENNGWPIGPFVIKARSKRGIAFLSHCDKALMLDEPRHAIRFSMDDLDSLFLTFSAASQLIAILELAGIEAQIADVTGN